MALTRISLLFQLRNLSDSGSWEEFVAIYSPVISQIARRHGVSEEDVDDIQQEVLLQMMHTLQGFTKDSRKGRFRNYISQITLNKIRDRWRKSSRYAVNIETPALIPDVLDPVDLWEEELNREIFHRVLQRVQKLSKEKTWICFDQHVLQKRSAAIVAEELGLTENAVFVNCSRTVARTRKLSLDLKRNIYGAEAALP